MLRLSNGQLLNLCKPGKNTFLDHGTAWRKIGSVFPEISLTVFWFFFTNVHIRMKYLEPSDQNLF